LYLIVHVGLKLDFRISGITSYESFSGSTQIGIRILRERIDP
jgi:hypothetical protein